MDYLYNFWSAAKSNKLSESSYKWAFLFLIFLYILVGLFANLTHPGIRDREATYFNDARNMYENKPLTIVAREQLPKMYVLSTVYRAVAGSTEAVQIFILRLSGLLLGAAIIYFTYAAAKRFFSGDGFAPLLAAAFLTLSLSLNINLSLIGGEAFAAFMFSFFLYEVVEVIFKGEFADIAVALALFYLFSKIVSQLAMLSLFLLVSAVIFSLFREFEEPLKKLIAKKKSLFYLVVAAMGTAFLFIVFNNFAQEISLWWMAIVAPLNDFMFAARKFYFDVTYYMLLSGETAADQKVFENINYYASIIISVLSSIGLIFFLIKTISKVRNPVAEEKDTRNPERLLTLFLMAATVYFMIASSSNFGFILQRNYVALLILPVTLFFITGLREISYRSVALFDFPVLIFLVLNIASILAIFIF